MNETLHLRIKKDYAANIIGDLNALGAVELVADMENVINTSASSDVETKTNDTLQDVNASPEWINTELYLYGEVYQEGGISPYIHILTKDYGKLLIAATKQQLLNADNILYKVCGVKVTGKQSLSDQKPFDLKLVSFVEYKPVFDNTELDLLIAKATPNLSEIKNVDEWLNQIRGYE